MQLRFKFPVVSLLVLAAVAVLAAGCGSGPSSPSVANLGSGSSGTTTTGTAPDGASSGEKSTSGSDSGGGSNVHMVMKTKNGAKFAACMRSHGVANFPDPNSQGEIDVRSSSGINPDSPKFRAAQDACQKLLPHGPPPTPQQQAKMQRDALAFSACMRRHGLQHFPDPTFSNGHISIGIKGGPSGGIDPQSPAFQAAQQACGGLLGMKGRQVSK
jgi:hypothetical protein